MRAWGAGGRGGDQLTTTRGTYLTLEPPGPLCLAPQQHFHLLHRPCHLQRGRGPVTPCSTSLDPGAPEAAHSLTWLWCHRLGDAEAVHLAEVAGQQAHARGGQDHGAQAPECTLRGKRCGTHRMGLGTCRA